MLAIIDTHPVQYRAPVYRALATECGVSVSVIFGSDYSLRAHHDREFGAEVSWDTDLVSGYRHQFLARTDPEKGGDVVPLPGRSIGAALRALAPQAVLLTGYSPAFHRRAWWAARRQRVPILFRAETTDRPQSDRPWVTAARDLALRYAYRRVARLLYIGARSRRHFEALGVEADRLMFSPYCVDTTPFATDEGARALRRPAFRARHGVAADDVLLAFSGKLSPRKGVDLIVEAVRRLAAPLRSRVVVALAGDGVLRESLVADAGRDPRVRLVALGVQTQSGLSDVYHGADVLVLPSRRLETWGLVVNEALHHGLPVVVSDQVGSASDLVDAGTGVVCAADDATALVAALERAMRLVGSLEVRDACRAKVAPYSVSSAAHAIASAYGAATRQRS